MKNRIIKYNALLGAGAVITLGVAGCGSSDSPTSSPGVNVSQSVISQPADASGMGGNGDPHDPLQKALPSIRARPGAQGSAAKVVKLGGNGDPHDPLQKTKPAIRQ